MVSRLAQINLQISNTLQRIKKKNGETSSSWIHEDEKDELIGLFGKINKNAQHHDKINHSLMEGDSQNRFYKNLTANQKRSGALTSMLYEKFQGVCKISGINCIVKAELSSGKIVG